MELYKYPGIRQVDFAELEEFLRRVLGSLLTYVPPYRAAGVYYEMATERVPVEGVSTEGASWAMEGAE